jgi:fluoroacetyl-CoA thioesterase
MNTDSETTVETATVRQLVTTADTASAYGPDFPAAAATPFVLGIAEVACHRLVEGGLEQGQVTVGTRAVIEHTAPTPVGVELVAVATLLERSGRRLRFEVIVKDDHGVCATVTHDRAIVSKSSIQERLSARTSNSQDES